MAGAPETRPSAVFAHDFATIRVRQPDDIGTTTGRHADNCGTMALVAPLRRRKIGSVMLPSVPPWSGEIEIDEAVALQSGQAIEVRVEWRSGCLWIDLVAIDRAVKPPSP